MDETTLNQIVRDRLFTAVLGDVMDASGLRRQFLPPEIRPLHPSMILVGRAMPVLEIDATHDDPWPEGVPPPFGLMLRALDSLQENEVYIAAGASPTYALWGGLMTSRALKLGAAGAVLAGYHRDTNEILSQPLALFSAGAYAQDQNGRGRVVDYRCRITFANGVVVDPGDLIVGDIDGVLVIPAAHVEPVIQAAITKVEGEGRVRTMIDEGMSTEAIFAELGIM